MHMGIKHPRIKSGLIGLAFLGVAHSVSAQAGPTAPDSRDGSDTDVIVSDVTLANHPIAAHLLEGGLLHERIMDAPAQLFVFSPADIESLTRMDSVSHLVNEETVSRFENLWGGENSRSLSLEDKRRIISAAAQRSFSQGKAAEMRYLQNYASERSDDYFYQDDFVLIRLFGLYLQDAHPGLAQTVNDMFIDRLFLNIAKGHLSVMPYHNSWMFDYNAAVLILPYEDLTPQAAFTPSRGHNYADFEDGNGNSTINIPVLADTALAIIHELRHTGQNIEFEHRNPDFLLREIEADFEKFNFAISPDFNRLTGMNLSLAERAEMMRDLHDLRALGSFRAIYPWAHAVSAPLMIDGETPAPTFSPQEYIEGLEHARNVLANSFRLRAPVQSINTIDPYDVMYGAPPALIYENMITLYRDGAFDENLIGKRYAYEYLIAAQRLMPMHIPHVIEPLRSDEAPDFGYDISPQRAQERR